MGKRGYMKTWRVIVLVLAGLVPFMACATTGGIKAKPISAGVSRNFFADYDRVLKAALVSVVELGLKIDEMTRVGNESTIVATKGVSLFSYGELIRVVVATTSPTQTTVRVITQRRLATNLTAKGDWSRPIFSQMESKLQ